MKQLTPILLCAAVAVLAYFTVTGSHGLLHLREINNEAARLEKKNRSLESEISQLQGEIAAIEKSDYSLEKKAREELGLSRDKEVVYIFSDNEARPSARK